MCHNPTPADPDDGPLIMPRNSRYAGQTIDVSSRRSIVIRPTRQRDELIAPGDARAIIDYFYHEGKFWSAVIPLDGVAEVYGQAFNFSRMKTRQGAEGREIIVGKNGLPKRSIPILNHVQCRFTLRPEFHVGLYPLGDDTNGKPVDRIRDFVYSAEVVGPAGVAFNIRDGLAGNLLNAHRFLSTREMVFERIVVENQYVTESPALPIAQSDQRELLVRGLLRSHAAGMTEAYYLYRFCGTNNCTSNPFRVLDRVVDYRLAQRIGALLYRMPFNPRLYLRVRGLDADPSVRKLVRTEFTEYIRDPSTQRRKRDYVRRQIRARRAARAAASQPGDAKDKRGNHE